jgi:chromosome segregation ATPase
MKLFLMFILIFHVSLYSGETDYLHGQSPIKEQAGLGDSLDDIWQELKNVNSTDVTPDIPSLETQINSDSTRSESSSTSGYWSSSSSSNQKEISQLQKLENKIDSDFKFNQSRWSDILHLIATLDKRLCNYGAIAEAVWEGKESTGESIESLEAKQNKMEISLGDYQSDKIKTAVKYMDIKIEQKALSKRLDDFDTLLQSIIQKQALQNELLEQLLSTREQSSARIPDRQASTSDESTEMDIIPSETKNVNSEEAQSVNAPVKDINGNITREKEGLNDNLLFAIPSLKLKSSRDKRVNYSEHSAVVKKRPKKMTL